MAPRSAPGAQCVGAHSGRVFDVDANPPGIRKAGYREVMEELWSPGLLGFLPSAATETHLDFSVMALRMAELLSDLREGSGLNLVRLVGTRTPAHKARKEADIT